LPCPSATAKELMQKDIKIKNLFIA